MVYIYHFYAIALDSEDDEDSLSDLDGIVQCTGPILTADDYDQFKAEVAAAGDYDPEAITIQSLSLIFASEGAAPSGNSGRLLN